MAISTTENRNYALERELQDLLTHLARFVRTNKTKISIQQVSKCLERLPDIEIAALERLSSFINQNKKNPKPSSVRTADSISVACLREDISSLDAHSIPGPALDARIAPVSTREDASHGILSTTSCAVSPLPMTSTHQHDEPLTGSDGICGNVTSSTQHNPSISLYSNTLLTKPTADQRGLPEDCATIVEDEAFSHSSISVATCSDLTFGPSVTALLEECKSDRGGFLRAIRQARVALPTGQGWESAIATKKDNADVRDLIKIYQRFECYNIYRHVVEAGYHTGVHWIRDMRATLVQKLCQDFPSRFPDPKTANRSLNWVDQGCRYSEWALLFSDQELLNLGYLIALPVDVSHSSYTSRCTKEQMRAAVVNLRSIGIDSVVKQFELFDLSENIVETLREMTKSRRKQSHFSCESEKGDHDLQECFTCPGTHTDCFDNMFLPASRSSQCLDANDTVAMSLSSRSLDQSDISRDLVPISYHDFFDDVGPASGMTFSLDEQQTSPVSKENTAMHSSDESRNVDRWIDFRDHCEEFESHSPPHFGLASGNSPLSLFEDSIN